MPVLATAADVEDRLWRDLADGEVHRVAGLLDELTADALTRVPELSAIEQPAPLAVRVVVSRAVVDAFGARTDGVAAETVGPFTRRYVDGSARGVRLSDEQVSDLRVAVGLPPLPRAKSISTL